MKTMLRTIGPDEFANVYQLIEESFPPQEFRPYEEELALLSCPNHTIYTLKDDERLQAFISEWILNNIRFIEYLAVNPYDRGSGLGTRVMHTYLNQADTPVILEVETPETLIAQRRIDFYKRLGFVLSTIEYIQPQLRENVPIVSLRLMYYPEGLSDTILTETKEEIFKIIYGRS